MIFPELKSFLKNDTIVYVDHKKLLVPETLDEIQNLISFNPNKNIIIRSTPAKKINIQQEIQASKSQTRYNKNIARTEKTIQNLVLNQNVKMEVRISNTGFIVYMIGI